MWVGLTYLWLIVSFLTVLVCNIMSCVTKVKTEFRIDIRCDYRVPRISIVAVNSVLSGFDVQTKGLGHSALC